MIRVLSMTLAAVLAATLFATPKALAHEFNIGGLIIDHPHALATAPTAQSGAGYLSIRNTTDETDVLIGLHANAAQATLHNTVEVGDVTRMVEVHRLVIPAGATVRFAPGGLHVMFTDLADGGLRIGDLIPTVFTFEKAGDMDVVFVVEESVSDGHHNH